MLALTRHTITLKIPVYFFFPPPNPAFNVCVCVCGGGGGGGVGKLYSVDFASLGMFPRKRMVGAGRYFSISSNHTHNTYASNGYSWEINNNSKYPIAGIIGGSLVWWFGLAISANLLIG
jgi:hypothetical protein